MRTLTLLRLILRLLRELKAQRDQQAGQLQAIAASLNLLVLIQAKQANYFPQAPPAADAKTIPSIQPGNFSDAITFAAAETVRSRLIEKLGRDPYEDEFYRELELEMTVRDRTQVVG